METWDYTTCEEYVKIETVRGDEVLDLICEIPIGGDLDAAERAAETICNAHNREINACLCGTRPEIDAAALNDRVQRETSE